MKSWRQIRHATLFLAAFTSTVAFVSHLSGYPEIGPLKEKLRYFERFKDNYEIVFIGSSRVYRGVIPTVFDDQMSSHGLSVKSFNFAMAGMKAHEANALVRRVLAMKPARLAWIIVEAGDWDPVIHKENRFKGRGIFWHDAPETWSALGSTLLLDDSLATRADLLTTHGLHFAARWLAVGRGPDAARSLFVQDKEPATDPLIAEWQGFKPYTESSYKYNPLRKRFLQNLDKYREAVTRLQPTEASRTAEATPRRSYSRPYNRAAVRGQIAMVRQAGVLPVHLITPTPRATPELDRLAREGHFQAHLAFNRPRAYPKLFEVERRFDHEHLTHEGALLFTRLLATRFATEVVTNDSDAVD